MTTFNRTVKKVEVNTGSLFEQTMVDASSLYYMYILGFKVMCLQVPEKFVSYEPRVEKTFLRISDKVQPYKKSGGLKFRI